MLWGLSDVAGEAHELAVCSWRSAVSPVINREVSHSGFVDWAQDYYQADKRSGRRLIVTTVFPALVPRGEVPKEDGEMHRAYACAHCTVMLPDDTHVVACPQQLVTVTSSLSGADFNTFGTLELPHSNTIERCASTADVICI